MAPAASQEILQILIFLGTAGPAENRAHILWWVGNNRFWGQRLLHGTGCLQGFSSMPQVSLLPSGFGFPPILSPVVPAASSPEGTATRGHQHLPPGGAGRLLAQPVRAIFRWKEGQKPVPGTPRIPKPCVWWQPSSPRAVHPLCPSPRHQQAPSPTSHAPLRHSAAPALTESVSLSS